MVHRLETGLAMRHTAQRAIPVRTQKKRRDGCTLSTLALAEYKMQTKIDETRIADMLETRKGKRRLRAMLHAYAQGKALYWK